MYTPIHLIKRTHPIHLLICEDDEDDALLIALHLRRGGLESSFERVQTPEAVEAALIRHPPDAVICDYNIPGFGAEQALQLLRAHGLDVPFILVSGQIGEERAAYLMRRGVHDVVLKDRLARLLPAVQRELRESAGRRARREAEDALQLSEQRFRLFAEHAPDVMFRCRMRPEPSVEYISPAARTVLGYTPEDLCGDPQRLFDAVLPEDRAALADSWRSPGPKPLVARWRRPDGGTAWTEQRVAGIRDADGELVAVEGILRDITDRVAAEHERERLEQQLRQSERLESLGRLSGGVAHDFNNLLAVVLGHTELALAAVPPAHPAHGHLVHVRDLAQRGADLTRQLLVFSREQPAETGAVDLNAVVSATRLVLEHAVGEDVEFSTELAADLRPAAIGRGEVERLLLNLVVNSRNAMPRGGRLTITTANLDPADDGADGVSDGSSDGGLDGELDGESGGAADLELDGGGLDSGLDGELDGASNGARAFASSGAEHGESGGAVEPHRYGLVRLSVSDTGSGMAAEVVKHALEPFFTTRPGLGHGTGLGLSTVYGTVKAVGGRISIDSAPGRGTTVHVDLPAARSLPSAAPGEGDAPVRCNTESVLVVEDDADVRSMVAVMLKRSGFRVTEAEGPRDALALAAAAEPPDLVLTDVIMPDMSGIDLAKGLRVLRPRLPVLLMSGYTADTLSGGAALPPRTRLIRKPFTRAALLTALAGLLDDQHLDNRE